MNEELTIGNVVRSVVTLGYFVVVVDDASTDNTVEIAKESGAVVLSNLKNIGAWKATQTGLRYAKKNGFSYVVTMDADGQHYASDISSLVEKQNDKKADVVVGNCTSRGSAGRHIAWHVFKAFNRLPVNDITSGFRMYSRQALNCFTSRQATMFEYQCVGVLLMAKSLGLKIDEVSVDMAARETGVSRIFHSWLAVGYYLLYSGMLSVTKAFPTKKERYLNRLQD